MRFKIPIIITPAKKTVPTGNKCEEENKVQEVKEKKGQLQQKTPGRTLV